jgi:hypothetical protein
MIESGTFFAMPKHGSELALTLIYTMHVIKQFIRVAG